MSTVPSATSRLARGALFAFASTLAACGASTASEPPTDARVDAPGSDARDDTGNPAPLYGLPAGDGSVDDTGGPMAEYGAPPPDGSVDDTGDPMADYGAPPPPDGG